MARDNHIKDWETEERLSMLRAVSDQSQAKIADFIGIAPSTLGEWKKKSKKIKAALSQDNVERSINVKNSIYRACNDRIMPVVEEEILYDEKGNIVGKKVKKKQVVIPASFAAQRYWDTIKAEDNKELASFIPVPERMTIPEEGEPDEPTDG